ncbi:polymerase [Comamonas testosteroni]|uniref:polymerase n=1 Tax=Comamonas testosteroni TaxID=285 RepID=UPI002660094C|nr:polymerase [Comamonas testosteroni]WKL16130.1 polymerase [Comamonas testosteroni]
MKQQPQRQPRLIGAIGLGLLALSYATALPWLVRGEAVDLVPFLCALAFGCCLIRPATLAFERASKHAKALAVALVALLAAAIATAVAGGHVQSWLAHLRTMPMWQVNHLFFLFFALLPLSKGIIVAALNFISQAARGMVDKP